LIYCIWLIVLTLVNPDQQSFQVMFSLAHVSVMIYQIISIFSLFNTGKPVWRWVKSAIAVIGGLGISTFVMNYLASILN
jgi:hypothetical protein